jgi:hypothetical protein
VADCYTRFSSVEHVFPLDLNVVVFYSKIFPIYEYDELQNLQAC